MPLKHLVCFLSLTTSHLALGKDSGQAVFVCGHSFHVFIPEPLAALAKEAGFSRHRSAGLSSIGGSRPIQHWELPEDQNPAKQALRHGEVDVLTLAPHHEMPEVGIDRFADFAITHQPEIRVMVQMSWPTEPLKPMTDWSQLSLILGEYWRTARGQVKTINARHGRTFVSLVPVAPAYLQLREEILAGRVPGIARFSELFTDELGHPSPPLQNLVTFCWFAAIYDQSPENLSALDAPATPVAPATNRVLQRLAWDAVLQEATKATNP